MANPPPLRVWSRLASLRSTPAPQPSEPVARASTPSSPAQNNVASSLNNNANANATKTLPTTTPAVQSHQNTFKLIVNPEIEPKIPVEEKLKTVVVNKTIEKPNVNDNGSLQKGLNKKLSDSEDSDTRVITITGENKGAYMEIIQSRKKPNYLHKMDNSKVKGYDYESENANKKDKSQKARTLSSRPRSGVYVNSNVQCINNSMVFHSCCTHHDPGVQLTLSKNPFGEGFHLKEQRN
ncbi:hypothetical protein SESBI_48275 [Sesbania bispinosa]|nr:hypothetical protein SESBI_48275 [Sesbania bispinosa]